MNRAEMAVRVAPISSTPVQSFISKWNWCLFTPILVLRFQIRDNFPGGPFLIP